MWTAAPALPLLPQAHLGASVWPGHLLRGGRKSMGPGCEFLHHRLYHVTLGSSMCLSEPQFLICQIGTLNQLRGLLKRQYDFKGCGSTVHSTR